MNNPLSQITEHVYLAGVTGVMRLDLMRAAGITHVLNVAGHECPHLTYGMESGPDVSCDYVDSMTFRTPGDGRGNVDSTETSDSNFDDAPSLTVRRVALRDSQDQSLLPYLDDLVDFVCQAVSSGGKVVVHCLAGVSRSASVVIAYLVRERGMSLKKAHDHVIARRDVIRPNPGFWAALVEYELNIRGENSVDILNFAAGSAPSLDSYQKEMFMRMRLGWMDHVFYNLGAQMFLLMVQMLGSLWVFSDYS